MNNLKYLSFSTVLIFILLSLFSCSNIRLVDNHGTNLLNGKNLSLEKLYLCRDTNTEKYQIRSQTVTYAKVNDTRVNFEEVNKTTGDIFEIIGNNTSGFAETIYFSDKPESEVISYRKDGLIKSINHFYINYRPNRPKDGATLNFSFETVQAMNGRFLFKKSIEFDETGHKIEVTYNEKYFKFTLKKIKKFISNRGFDLKIGLYTPLITRIIKDQKGLWQLYVLDPKKNLKSVLVVLDGKYGEINK